MLDLFSGGGGGWCLAARSLGLPSVGIEWDGPACGTRAVVGLPTIRADVSQYPAERFAGKVEGLCGGPPCQSFSSAGKGKGLDDPRGQMVYEPMRYVRACGPRWVALEQVPEVLGYWRWIARELATMGYLTWAGILECADYGVPQCRRRAILLASLDRKVSPPAPTHSKYGHPNMLGETLPRWVSMAEGLGWGLTDSPAYTVCGTGGHADGASTSGQRRQTAKAKAAGNWVLRSPGRSYGAPPRRADAATEPAPTVALGHNAAAWCWERPATTVAADARVFGPHSGGNGDSHSANAIPVEAWELGVLQGFPADHPWQPPRVSAQIGNAIPPPLALACLRAVTGAAA